ncbi:GDSL-like lipase/acylhydrolase [Blumeria hordei DH14]|uniref:GDSL-like lipase/acylhydrolase n=1 Tax=Blumeria graminis f. sp. hordei (strain DH14) TaxID=546991 RepID=N1JLC8_BLUG1|nr:GDSL-like lipase/acylhydrolase [Blumeria hordei DH14]
MSPATVNSEVTHPPKIINILCFGDSLTEGFTSTEVPDHPYATSLQAVLAKRLASHVVSVQVQGLGGDKVTGNFLMRMKALCESACSVDFAVILGGTNDLISNQQTRDIWPVLKNVWEIPLACSSIVLALTIPECGLATPQVNAEREALNSLIRNHHSENFHVFDLSEAMPYWEIPTDQRRLLWADTIHFSEKGYDLVGAMIADQLASIIEALPNSTEIKEDYEKVEL